MRPLRLSPPPTPHPNPVPLAPEVLFAEVGPFKAFLPGVSADDASPELDAMIRFAGGFMVILGCMLVTVRWNTINGKLSGMAWSAIAPPRLRPPTPCLLSGCPLRTPASVARGISRASSACPPRPRSARRKSTLR